MPIAAPLVGDASMTTLASVEVPVETRAAFGVPDATTDRRDHLDPGDTLLAIAGDGEPLVDDITAVAVRQEAT